ncbi:uncharacterized protein A4U43_C04F18790 [Asparagus officinalis]|uniref:Rad21/Rec8-like protein N-terminal domain-containing protein n=1 Tax=Asparagus officinalis TaxID=4686 RepID=A0A5P1F1Z3_ASPOF|nr:uncharacterized protein A4U43_C04F18790 [Asparagus officinalis]
MQDSILFPEVPIALRLSSHLLLGVVRIYSRKVNYLFHDCSEALLKVKQAFRSTAVDLPPEESTAPYHSITLPETFDLDDFELPDSALLSGNFDDRHVSTREQITLQDTLDGSGYSTSRFGLDERFGEGDASQIALDLDEELLLDSNITFQDASVLDDDVHQAGAADLGQQVRDEDRNDDASNELSDLLGNNRGKHIVSTADNVNVQDDSSHRLIFNIQTPDLNEIFLPDNHIGGPSAAHDIDMDFAAGDHPSPEFTVNFPSTPGLLEETIQANSQELSASNPQKITQHTALEAEKPINQEVECPDATNDRVINATIQKSANLSQVVSSPTSVLAEPKPDSINDAGHKHDLSTTFTVVSSSSSVLTEATPAASHSLGGTSSGSDVLVRSTDPKLAEISPALPSSTLGHTEPVPQCSDEVIAASGVDLGSNLNTGDTLHGGISEDLAGSAAVMDKTTLVDPKSLSNLDQERVEDANCNQTNNFSSLTSDFHLRSCTSESNLASLMSPEGVVQERAQEFSFRAEPCNLETQTADKETLFSKAPAHLQGRENCFSSAELPEPERLRFAPPGSFDLLTVPGEQTIDKGVHESDGSVDRINNLSGKKRHLIDGTPDLQNGMSPMMSGIPRKKRNNDYIIPDDDDLLASILVGRRSSVLKMGPTPPLPKAPPVKRPRLTTKVGLPKRRKVLLDDTIVLHADTIRQQLINTGDIRRMRKKVPCTRPEIWRIQNSLLEDDIFGESIFTGVSEELNRLLARGYGLAQNVHYPANGQHTSSEATQNLASSGFVRDSNGREVAEQSATVPKIVGGEVQVPSGTSKLIETEISKNAASIDAQEQLEAPINPQPVTPRPECPVPTDSRAEEKHHDMSTELDQNSLNKVYQNSHELAKVNNTTLNAGLPSIEGFTSAECASRYLVNNNVGPANANNDTSLQVDDFSNGNAASITVEDMGVDIVNITNAECPQDNPANMSKNEDGETQASMLDRFIDEVGTDFPADSSTIVGHANSVPDLGLVDGEPVTRAYQAMKQSEEGKINSGYEVTVDEEMLTDDVLDGGRHHTVSFPIPTSTGSERVPSAVGENSCMNTEGGMDVESTHMEFGVTREPSDFCSAIDDIDTDFLNVDDEADEYDEETNCDVPNTEAQSLENSGWSSRTRGVARYLKNIFDQESGRGRKSVAIDHLLAGKTRKEASRMFFETLVLKTKDYIHVEQENPFDFVNIKPRIKILKSEF